MCTPKPYQVARAAHANTPGDTVFSVHLPHYDKEWLETMMKEKWTPYSRPIMVMAKDGHQFDYRTLKTPGDNTQYWLSFYKKGETPLVPAAHMMKHPRKNDPAIRTVWNTGVMVPSHKVPKVERVRDATGTEALRVQQLRGSSVAKIIHVFTRASELDKQAIIVDPFAGAGGVAVAAKLTGCYFIGVDKSQECVTSVRDLEERLANEEGYANGAGLMKNLTKKDPCDEEVSGSQQGTEDEATSHTVNTRRNPREDKEIPCS